MLDTAGSDKHTCDICNFACFYLLLFISLCAKLTTGHKWTIFLSEFLYSIAAFVVAAIAFLIAEAIDVSLICLILIVAVVALSMVGYIGINTVIYRTLTDEAEAEK